MNITIIGAGNMGRGIGTRAVAGGHSVTFVDASPETAEKAAADVRASAKNGATVSAAPLGDVQLGDVVVLAVWYGTNIEIAKQLGNKLAGKVVVDIANPLNSTYDGLATAPEFILGGGFGESDPGRRESGQGVQHDVCRHASFWKCSWSAARRLYRRRRRGRQIQGRADRHRRRHAPRGRRSVEPRPPDRRDAVAAHRHPGHAWHELGQCVEDLELMLSLRATGSRERKLC